MQPGVVECRERQLVAVEVPDIHADADVLATGEFDDANRVGRGGHVGERQGFEHHLGSELGKLIGHRTCVPRGILECAVEVAGGLQPLRVEVLSQGSRHNQAGVGIGEHHARSLDLGDDQAELSQQIIDLGERVIDEEVGHPADAQTDIAKPSITSRSESLGKRNIGDAVPGEREVRRRELRATCRRRHASCPPQ